MSSKLQDVYSYVPDKRLVATIYAMLEIFGTNKTEAILPVDAKITFNTFDRKVLLHSTAYLCPEIAIFICNCYVRNTSKIIYHRW